MPTEKIYWLVDELHNLGYRGKVSFHHLSDSLLDKRYLDVVTYVKNKGMRIYDATNGDVLRKNDALTAKLDGLVETFMIGLYDYSTYKEKQEEIRFWKNRFKKTEIVFSTPLEDTNIRQDSELYSEMKKDDGVLDQPCPARLGILHVRYDGEVYICCQDNGCDFGLGNVFEDGIEAVLWSEKKRQIVENLKKPGGRRKYELCSKCYIDYGKPNPNDQVFAINNRNGTINKWKIGFLEFLWRKGLIGLDTVNKSKYF